MVDQKLYDFAKKSGQVAIDEALKNEGRVPLGQWLAMMSLYSLQMSRSSPAPVEDRQIATRADHIYNLILLYIEGALAYMMDEDAKARVIAYITLPEDTQCKDLVMASIPAAERAGYIKRKG